MESFVVNLAFYIIGAGRRPPANHSFLPATLLSTAGTVERPGLFFFINRTCPIAINNGFFVSKSLLCVLLLSQGTGHIWCFLVGACLVLHIYNPWLLYELPNNATLFLNYAEIF